MSRKRLLFGLGGMAAAVVAAVAGVLWWSQGRAVAYSGMAAHFPDRTAVFVEAKHVGQWMDLPGGVEVQPEPIRSQDPLLGVLGRVWAAERIRPEDLPVALKDQPVAMGVWKEGESWKGAGLLAVAPAVRQPLEEFLRSKLGQGDSVGDASGVRLYRAQPQAIVPGCAAEVSADTQLVWGVGDAWAVVASGVDEARQVLTAQARPLDSDPDFLDAAERFPLERGAWVFIRGSELRNLTAGGKCSAAKAEETPAGETADAEAKGPGDGESLSEMPGKMVLGALMASMLPEKGTPNFAAWTSPPDTPQGTWDVRAWMSGIDGGEGFFQILSEGGSRRVDLLGRVTRDGTSYVWAGGEDPARFYRRAMDEMARVAPPDKVSTVRAAVGALEGKLGVSLANDLLPTLGDEWCLVMKTVPGEGDAKGEEKAALFVSLRDSRRIETLMREKVGPSMSLTEGVSQGHPAWMWKPGEGGGKPDAETLQILIADEALVVTAWPAWAMGSAGGSKAWERARTEEGRLAFLAVADPSAWGQAGKPPIVVSGTREDHGILVKATFTGERPKIPFLESPDAPPAPPGTAEPKEPPQPPNPSAKGAV